MSFIQQTGLSGYTNDKTQCGSLNPSHLLAETDFNVKYNNLLQQSVAFIFNIKNNNF